MVGSHAGHDCQIGSGSTFVNNALLGGHVIVGDHVIVGGGTAVHQFCRIGRGAMLSGATAMTKDVLPYCLLTALNICGSLNLVGMRRSGMPSEDIDAYKWAFRAIYRYGHSPRQCLEALRERQDEPPVAEYIEFIESSARGICSSRGSAARGTAQKGPK
jgi:UDP-N-acetylglucosamine acyltransferase